MQKNAKTNQCRNEPMQKRTSRPQTAKNAFLILAGRTGPGTLETLFVPFRGHLLTNFESNDTKIGSIGSVGKAAAHRKKHKFGTGVSVFRDYLETEGI
jgi:hypothetical protein